MFVVAFVIMLPIALKTGDPVKGWEAGLTWVFIQSFVLMVGGFVAPYIRRITPRAALLGTLAGVSIAFISLRPALEMFMTPVIGVVCFAIMLIGAQAFQETPKSHAPAIVLALVPHVAAWGKLQIDNALSAAGTSVAAVGVEKLGQSGILYEGLSVLGYTYLHPDARPSLGRPCCARAPAPTIRPTPSHVTRNPPHIWPAVSFGTGILDSQIVP